MKDDRLHLIHMQERIELIQSFTVEGYEHFSQTSLNQEAVLRCLEVIGEAARRLSDDFRAAYPDIPWGQMIGLRNKLIHNYDTVTLKIVWNIIQEDLPPLYQQVKAILDAEDKSTQ